MGHLQLLVVAQLWLNRDLRVILVGMEQRTAFFCGIVYVLCWVSTRPHPWGVRWSVRVLSLYGTVQYRTATAGYDGHSAIRDRWDLCFPSIISDSTTSRLSAFTVDFCVLPAFYHDGKCSTARVI